MMFPSQFKALKRHLNLYRKTYRRFLTKAEKSDSKQIDAIAPELEKEVWKDIDCLACSNCCRKMTPTFTREDIKRISAHFGQTPAEFKAQWLEQDKNNDWVNKIQPCQFLNLKTNMCNIYEIRPIDCAGFPHLSKKKFKEYAHIHKQNIEYCPATLSMMQKIVTKFEGVVK
ncbi:MAG TPA: YkgJ family cysteine cluster protein [Ferruginibacter sp.]|nr:YkgJ family cysteine cluster protein [Ferruginibacter sp.]HRE62892.1 YkgJ family cysteine cluster protein [Ferruginibacter sp.]